MLTEISTKLDYFKNQNTVRLDKIAELDYLPSKKDILDLKIFNKQKDTDSETKKILEEIKNYTQKLYKLTEDNKKTIEEIRKIVLS